MKYTAFITTSILLLCLAVPGSVLAQNSTESGSPVDSVTRDIKERVQKALDAGPSEVTGVTSSAGASFGIIGTLEKVIGSTIQIQTITGVSRVCELDKSSQIFRQGKLISREEIELNSPIIVTGTKDVDGVYKIKTLKIADESIFPSKRQTILGILSSQTTKAFTLSLLGSNRGTSTTIPFTVKTTYYDMLDQKIDKKKITNGQKVLFILPGEVQTATASALRVYALSVQPSAQ